ncbi:MAG TPA: hypothetical protein VG758_19825 [Hyphomicrobiaceae bacterium]|jgi:hypothetical protein|nr:hypothetical protein [Hyphomicrobiaceae bacterium]
MTAYRIKRDIDKREQPWMEIRAGEIVYAYAGCTYGCIGAGLAVSRRRGETPFFEVPKDAIEPISALANRPIVRWGSLLALGSFSPGVLLRSVLLRRQQLNG